jgi:hypothetical protein
VIGAILCVITLAGAWIERRRVSIIFAFGVLTSVFVYYAYLKHYGYGAYKIVSINGWMLGFLTIAGGLWFTDRITPRLPKWAAKMPAIAVLLLVVSLDRILVETNAVNYGQNALEQTGHREALEIAAIVKNMPTLLSVRDGVANEWAVFYLSDTPLLIVPYRLYMAQAHVIPFMERAKVVDPAEISYIVTDHSDTVRAPVSGGQRVWDGQAYSLWKVNDANWAVLADVINPPNIGAAGVWLGASRTQFLFVTARNGPATLTAKVLPGPGAPPGNSEFHITLEDTTGKKQTMLRLGENRLPVDLSIGKGMLAITVEAPFSGPAQGNGELRPMILQLEEYGIERADSGRP